MSLGRERPTIDVQRREGANMAWLWILLAVVVLGLIIWGIVASMNEDRSAPPTSAATINNITANPGEYLGREVTVSGEVNNVLGPRAFTIGGDEFFGGDELLVVGAQDFPALADRLATEPIAEDDVVQVTGPVRAFNLAEFEREIGLDLDDTQFADWAGRPAVVAQSVNLNPRVARQPEQAPRETIQERPVQPQPRTQPRQDVPVNLSMITDNPSEFYGQRITVSGVVNDIVNPNAFTLSPMGGGVADAEVLVAGAENMIPQIRQGQTVQVSGTVQEFDLATFERDLGADWNDQLFEPWGDRPAIMANNISIQGNQQGMTGQRGQTGQPGMTGQPGTTGRQPGATDQQTRPGTTGQQTRPDTTGNTGTTGTTGATGTTGTTGTTGNTGTTGGTR